jgi:hypothetical protein
MDREDFNSYSRGGRASKNGNDFANSSEESSGEEESSEERSGDSDASENRPSNPTFAGGYDPEDGLYENNALFEDRESIEEEEEDLSEDIEDEVLLAAATISDGESRNSVRQRHQRQQARAPQQAERASQLSQRAAPPLTSLKETALMLSMWLFVIFVLLRYLPLEERWGQGLQKMMEPAITAMCFPLTGLAFFAGYEYLYMTPSR